MFCISISHKNAGAEIREKLAFTSDIQQKIMSALCDTQIINQCVLLCTCNRTEVYFCGNSGSAEEVKHILAGYSKTDEAELSPYFRQYHGDKAIRHLFEVACGIDSMVIGEDEILGQTKNAYTAAQECGTVSFELNMIFQAAIACAKKIKTETALSKTSVSFATLAANEAKKLGENVNVLVIGATGKTGSTVLKNLLSCKNVNVTATLRSHNTGFGTAADSLFKTADYADRYSLTDEADCVISATSSPHYTITLNRLKKSLIHKKDRLFIDLAVPADIEENITQLDGVKRIGIDYFEKLAQENNALKLDSVDAAGQIIAEETDTLKKDIAFHNYLPYRENAGTAISEKLLYQFKSELDSSQFEAVLEVLKNYKEQL
ncbi:MAG: glutamyl-tRNA reductase [Porcipelethomonas sp.]